MPVFNERNNVIEINSPVLARLVFREEFFYSLLKTVRRHLSRDDSTEETSTKGTCNLSRDISEIGFVTAFNSCLEKETKRSFVSYKSEDKQDED
ncbi:hypothetical protein AVEN_267973-1 [Araneus ventricosus]|uniref:Uncharacterized protein n=1 Tax=Araneus ventricosus TaxID=182803 RepID=A0A4Y2WIE8_ARAVE|nr:hypothetical protein AVEN_267973-1 [Araneus ventricosus]